MKPRIDRLSTVLLILLLGIGDAIAEQLSLESTREALWGDVEFQISRLRDEIGFARLTPEVGKALRQVPREQFVPGDQRQYAYENRPLPIGYGQTISQPYIVALMTDLLELKADDTVLEIGTGSGYQAAILAELAGEVYSIWPLTSMRCVWPSIRASITESPNAMKAFVFSASKSSRFR